MHVPNNPDINPLNNPAHEEIPTNFHFEFDATFGSSSLAFSFNFLYDSMYGFKVTIGATIKYFE